jgi:hypothetical protein
MQKIVALLIKTGYYRSNKSINDKVPPGTAIPDGTNSNDVHGIERAFYVALPWWIRFHCTTAADKWQVFFDGKHWKRLVFLFVSGQKPVSI